MGDRLRSKVAIITGAASGMGRAQAELFVGQGAHVVLGDVNPAVHGVAQALGDQAIAVDLDVSQVEQWSSTVTHALATFGHLDILVNTAGIAGSIPFLETTGAQFERMFQINQLGVFLGMQAVVPPMRDNGGGSIVNVASGAALRASAGMVGYSATKWAVRGMTRGVAVELAKDGIRVNVIHPGVIDTPLLAGNTPEMNDRLRAKIPFGRLGTPGEIAQATLFLASDESSYMSGADLAVDGATYA